MRDTREYQCALVSAPLLLSLQSSAGMVGMLGPHPVSTSLRSAAVYGHCLGSHFIFSPSFMLPDEIVFYEKASDKTQRKTYQDNKKGMSGPWSGKNHGGSRRLPSTAEHFPRDLRDYWIAELHPLAGCPAISIVNAGKRGRHTLGGLWPLAG